MNYLGRNLGETISRASGTRQFAIKCNLRASAVLCRNFM